MKYNVWIYDNDNIAKIEACDDLIVFSCVSEDDALCLARMCAKNHHNIAMFPIVEDADLDSEQPLW